MRAPKGNLCLSTFSMHCHHDLTLPPLFVFVSVKAATVLGQPFPKCGTFHRFVPIYEVLSCVKPSSASLEIHYAKLSDVSLTCVKHPSDRLWPKSEPYASTVREFAFSRKRMPKRKRHV